MLPFAGISLSCVLLIAFGAIVWLLIKDGKYWRDQYQTLVQEARTREQQLFDQLLKVKGFRTTTEPLTPQPAIARQPVLDSEDLEIIDSRINERVEAGIMRPSEGMMLATQVRDGSLKPAELDRILWKRQQTEFPGSVADID